MERHREPLAAVVAAIAVFVGLVAPTLALALAIALVGAGLAMLLPRAGGGRTEVRRRMQNPR